MSAKKKTSRIKQTRTEFQKAFDPYPGMITAFYRAERILELLHISKIAVKHNLKQCCVFLVYNCHAKGIDFVEFHFAR